MDAPFSGYKSESKRTKIRGSQDTMKALAFNWPYWPMVAQGMLFLGDLLVKTRDAPWNYRGPVLAYTNSRVDKQPDLAYGFADERPTLQTLHGVAELVDVRPLTDGEKLILHVL